MGVAAPFASLRRWLHALYQYVDHTLRRRARIKKARKDDPNIYPFW